jgi:MFS family permease
MQNTNVRLLFTTRIIRLFAYGFLSVALALYLVQVGLSEGQIGLLFTLTLAGDAVISLWLTTSADRLGRRRMLRIGAALMLLAGIVFVITHNFVALAIAGIIGVISPSGGEIGPFLSIEQAALSQLIPNERRTQLFAWYNLVGSFATALGALAGGWLMQGFTTGGTTPLAAYRAVIIGYAILGAALLIIFTRLSQAVEAPQVQNSAGNNSGKTPDRPPGSFLGLHKSRNVVLRLSALFALDAFGGAFVLQSMMAYWFHLKFGVEPAVLGSIFFAANILAGISALSAASIAARFGLINTMVWTHIPSNVLLMLVPLMPNLWLASIVLLLRFSISQMDVPTRQSYTMAVVDPDERSAASGVTAIARSIGAAASPVLSGLLLGSATLISLPFFIAGGLKIVYDLALYRSFRALKPPEEQAKS